MKELFTITIALLCFSMITKGSPIVSDDAPMKNKNEINLAAQSTREIDFYLFTQLGQIWSEAHTTGLYDPDRDQVYLKGKWYPYFTNPCYNNYDHPACSVSPTIKFQYQCHVLSSGTWYFNK